MQQKDFKKNFKAFIWHGLFLAVASSFMDIDTIIPAMLIKAGGGEILLGFLTAIMIGGAGVLKLVFASLLSHKNEKNRSY